MLHQPGKCARFLNCKSEMANIGFTEKKIHVYTRFNALRRAYEDANGGGRIYNPDFLTVLMDAFEKGNVENLQEKEAAYNFLCNLEAFAKTLGEAGHLHGKVFVIVPLYFERRFEIFTPSYVVDSSPDRWELTGSFDLPKNELQ